MSPPPCGICRRGTRRRGDAERWKDDQFKLQELSRTSGLPGCVHGPHAVVRVDKEFSNGREVFALELDNVYDQILAQLVKMHSSPARWTVRPTRLPARPRPYASRA